MPNWMDLLGAASRPMVPKRAISGLQEALAPGSSYDGNDMEPDSDTDDSWLSALLPEGIGQVPAALSDIAGNIGQHPLETLGGFASGALEGLRNQTTPVNAATMLAGPALGAAGRAASPVMREAAAVARPTLDVLEDLHVPQIKPSMGDVDAVLGDAYRQMAKVPNASGKFRYPGQAQSMEGMAARASQPAPSQLPPEFVPRGGEAAFNAGRPASFGPDVNLPPNSAPGGRAIRLPVPVPNYRGGR